MALFFRTSTRTDIPRLRNAGEVLNFLLYWDKIIFPDLNDLIHWGRRGWEVLLLAVVMQHGVVVSKEGVLYADLRRKKMRKKGEGDGDQLREMATNMVVGSIVFLCGS